MKNVYMVKAITEGKVYLRKEFIESMKVLITRYEAAISLGISKQEYEGKRGLDCLLCHPIDVHMKVIYDLEDKLGTDQCEFCPWKVITGDVCTVSATVGEHFTVYETDDIEIMNDRIEQLKEWITLYEGYGDAE